MFTNKKFDLVSVPTTFLNVDPNIHRIKSVQITQLSDADIESYAKTIINNPSAQPEMNGGLLDPHLGTMSDQYRCSSCNNTRTNCQGHFGRFKVLHPYISPHMIKTVEKIIKQICLECVIVVKDNKKCPVCSKKAIVVKGTRGYKYILGFENKEYIYTPRMLKNLFSQLSLESVEQLGIGIHPEQMILDNVYISPIMTRPDKKIQASVVQNDGFTGCLSSIVKIGSMLNKMNENDKQNQKEFEQTYNQFLRSIYNYQFDNKAEEQSGSQKSLSSLLVGKDGTIRGKIMGKNGDKLGRCVIACNTKISPDEVIIPQQFAMTVFVKEKVMDFNYERLLKFFKNGPTQYPGANYVRKANGDKFHIGNSNVELEIGDTLFRHQINGDPVLMNRQPSLWIGSIGCHKINVAKEQNTDTLDLNVIGSKLYNFDFDGDEMNCYFLSNQTSIAEANMISAVNTRIISFTNGALLIAQMQDSVIGGHMLTQKQVKMDEMFVIRMNKNTRVISDYSQFRGEDGLTTGSDVISYNFPKLSHMGKSKYVNREYSKYIDYDMSQEVLNIELGRLKSGYFDANGNEYLKTIALNYDPTTALNTIFSVQQTILNFNMYTGLSIGYNELKHVNTKAINELRNGMVKKAQLIMYQYANNMMNHSLGKTVNEEFTERFTNAFFDDSITHIMEASDIRGDYVNNSLMRLSITGSKGSIQNIKQMLIYIGQTLVEGAPLKPLFFERINMFFKKNDINPISQGVVLNSYLSGLSPSELLINSISERVQMLSKVLTVAKPGSMGRKLIKNLENINTCNNRMIAKTDAIYQDLFGYDGFSVQCLSRFKIPMFYEQEHKFTEWFMKTCTINATKQQSTQMEEYVNKISDLITISKITMCRLEFVNNQTPLTDTIQIPVTVQNIVDTHLQQLNSEPVIDNLMTNMEMVDQFCEELPYIYFNDATTTVLRDTYKNGVNCLKIALYCILTFDKLSKFNPNQMKVLLQVIKLTTKESMMPLGTPCGVQSAQALQEYFTQDMLDSIHKFKSSGDSDVLERIMDIFNNRTPANLQSLNRQMPRIRIPLKLRANETEQQSRGRAQEIVNKLKVITLNILIVKWEIIMTNIEHERDPSFIDDKQILTAPIPSKYSSWCFRFVLDKTKMFVNDIVIEQIQQSIQYSHDVYIIYYQTDTHIVMRVYLSNESEFQSNLELREQLETLIQFNIRGISGVDEAIVLKEKIHMFDSADKSIGQQERFVILTESHNLRDIMRQQIRFQDDIDFDSVTCDNQTVMLRFFGRAAAQQKIYHEIRGIFGSKIDPRHVSFVTSVMIQQGSLSILDADGIRMRNKDTPLISITESRSIINMVNNSLVNKVNKMQSLSDNTLFGQLPIAGCTYNQLVLNPKFLASKKESTQDIDI